MKGINYPKNFPQSSLPYSDYPTIDFPMFYYKIKEKVGEQRQIVRIGLQLHCMRRFEEDHLVYLIQIFNHECPRIHFHVIVPNFIYGEVNIDIQVLDQTNLGEKLLQHKLMALLRSAIEYFQQFIEKTLEISNFNSKKFTEQEFEEKFNNNVIIKIKEREQALFSRNYGKK